MSDQPPKPKPGSLRERIAAFEKPASSSAAAATPPVPRPKPGGISWKPKAPSPPSSPGSSSVDRLDVTERKAGGMSASDAKESIGIGGSLKERMAALQGRGAFGGLAGAAPPVAPKPVSDKPKWKPPPRPVSPIDKGTDEPPSEDPITPAVAEEAPKQEEGDEPPDQAEEKKEEVNPEEEERQRRAAIAARMARLGGARVGIAPPIFGKKPVPAPPPKEEVHVEEPKSEEEPSAPPPEAVTSEKEAESDEVPPIVHRDSSASSLLSADAESTQSSRSPASMPIPVVPRRAAPPRKKAAKSPSPVPTPQILAELTTSPDSLSGLSSGTEQDVNSLHVVERQPEVGEVNKSADPVISPLEPAGDDTSETVQELIEEPSVETVKNEELQVGEGPTDASPEVPSQEDAPAADTEHGSSILVPDSPSAEHVITEEPAEEIQEPQELEEDEETTRRKRVAERLAKMGGFNPLTAPQRSPSLQGEWRSSVDSFNQASPLLPERRGSLRKDSFKSPGKEVYDIPRKSSADSTSSPPPVPRNTRPINPPASPPISPEVHSPHNLEAGPEEPEEYDLRERSPLYEATIPEAVDDEPYQSQVDQEDEIDKRNEEHSAEFIQEQKHENADDDPVASQRYLEDGQHDVTTIAEIDNHESIEVLPPRMDRPPVPSSTRPYFTPEGDSSDSPVQSPTSPGARRSLPHPPRPIPVVPTATRISEGVTSPRRSIPPPPSVDDVDPVREATPPPPEDDTPFENPDDKLEVEQALEEEPPAPPPRRSYQTSVDHQNNTIRASAQSSAIRSPLNTTFDPPHAPEQEVLDESEGDPIDPGFHSPRRSPTELQKPLPLVSHTAEGVTTEEDEDQVRRRTIAERMAKLGGIKFGATPLPLGRPPAARETEISDEAGLSREEETLAEIEQTEEEEEQARKQRITAKLAGMGGMRFGMMPPGISPRPSPPPHPKRQSTETGAPPPPPQQQDTDSEFESLGTSDDGVQVEAEESELEETGYVEVEEEAPPPVPSRVDRRSSIPSASRSPEISRPGGRPPVPTVPSTTSRRPSVPGSRKSSIDTSAIAPPTPTIRHAPSEYVMVEEPEELSPPPPPTRPQPSRTTPRAPTETSDLAKSHWELPSIPTSSLDIAGGGDLSLSTWSEDSTTYPSSAPAPEAASPAIQLPSRRSSQVPPPTAAPKPPADLQLTSDELMAIWGRIGVLVCEAATALFEKSKKALVGDGSYAGFVNAAIGQVPDALPPTPPSYGYLIYAQTGPAVQRRASDIMPGDVVVLYDAKLKGHKGLQTYHQNVGAGEPLIAIVSEFEVKKSKIKVYQANQHVGQQTVEPASYRLEDLKSGNVKIFRVLDCQ